jgi:NAD-dependent dihydropyrimidine dehydrogenase PreA subunit
VKTRLITVEGKRIGIAGLDDIFEELHKSRRKPDKNLKDYLLGRLKELNYIPSSKEAAYAEVLLEEYQRFCDLKEGRIKERKKSLKPWRGIPREEIPWYPTILEELCDGCGICVRFCSFGVYETDEKANKVRVANPFYCEVGCSICAAKCKPKAIIFPPLSMLDMFRRR